MAEQYPTAEIWKTIPGFEGMYEVSSLGNVRSLDRIVRGNHGGVQVKRGRILKQEIAWTGYHSVVLWRDKAGRKEMVHRLVLSVFAGPPSIGQDCDHINFNRSDNRLENLRWLSRKENVRHSARAGRLKSGERHHNSKLTEEAVRDIRRRRVLGEKQTSIAKDYGVHQTTISEIDCGHYWNHVS